MDDRVYLSSLLDMFDEAEDASCTSRQKAERDVDYYDGKQLTEAELKEYKKRGQPPVVQNEIRNKIDYLQGLEREQRTQPQALPNKPQHEHMAQAATDALRSVTQENQYDEIRSKVWGDLLKAGWGGHEISVEMKPSLMNGSAMTPPQYRIVVRRCQWDRMFWDPHSEQDDFSDATYLGMVIWMDREQGIRMYGPEAAAVFDETVRGSEVGGTYDDKPKNHNWVNLGKRTRIRVIQMFHIGEDGEWDFCEFTRGGIMRSGPSPWIDEEGKREHGYCWRSAYVDRDNNRYGVVRDMIDPQDEMTKRRSFLLHAHTSRQTFGNQKFSKNLGKNKRALNQRNGHVEMIGEAKFGVDFGIIPQTDQTSGHAELLAQTMDFFARVGPNAAMQGKKEGDESGRAIIAQQKGGAIQMGTITDALRQTDFDVYRKIWNRIRQFWTDEYWVRVTDVVGADKKVRFVGLNEPVQDEFGNVIGIKNNIADMDVDIFIDDAPAGATVEIEQFNSLVGLAQAGVTFPPQVYIEAAPGLRNKDKLIQTIEEQQNQPNPVAEAGAKAEVESIAAKARKDNADAEGKEIENVSRVAVLTAPPPPVMGLPAPPMLP